MRARLRAGRGGDRLLVEREAAGCVYRLLFLEGRLLDVLRQRPPTVEGDGRSTVEELIARENRRRTDADGELGTSLLRVDLDCVLTLARAGLDLASVPAAGALCTVKTVSNEGRVEDCASAAGELCDEIVEDARRAARLLGLKLAGVDVITADPTRPLGAGGVITEVNGGPALHRHHQVAGPEPARRVAEPILDRLLEPRPAGRGWIVPDAVRAGHA
jgi:cyanophycin synthetase